MTEDEIKVKYGLEFKRCLIDLDVDGMMKLWKHVAPHLAAGDRNGTLYSMHLARTQMETCPIGLKLYSQRWLNERKLGSFMPEDQRGH